MDITVFEEFKEWSYATDGTVLYIDDMNIDKEVITFEERSVDEIAAKILYKTTRLDESESEDEEQTVESAIITPVAVEVLSMVET